MTTPNFVYIGPDKAGSSWLYRFLRWHPDVYVTPAKDLYYFDRYYSRGPEWYRSKFPGSAGHAVVAEVCHDYLFSPLVARRIASDLPGAQMMVTLREPVERAYSAYLNLRRHGLTDEMEAALGSHPELVAHGRYAEHLAPYLELFGRERMHLAVFDDLASDPQMFADRLCGFLGIARHPLPADILAPERGSAAARFTLLAKAAKTGAGWVRKSGSPTAVGIVKNSAAVQRVLYRPLRPAERKTLAPALQAELRRIFADEVIRLEQMIGAPLASRWGYSAAE